MNGVHTTVCIDDKEQTIFIPEDQIFKYVMHLIRSTPNIKKLVIQTLLHDKCPS